MIEALQADSCCPCDKQKFPPGLDIIAGMPNIPRSIAGFTAFRNAMLSDISHRDPLRWWHAREGDDLGIMLIEMWAYICDSISFYDEVIANESYLRTARQRASIMKLAALLSYRPRPAVASTAWLAALAEGRQLIKIPTGTAFRSGAFDKEAPQVFETTDDSFIHPFTNAWNITPPVPETLGTTNPPVLLTDLKDTIREGDKLFILNKKEALLNQVVAVSQVVPYNARNKKVYHQVSLLSPPKLPATTNVDDLSLLRPNSQAKITSLTTQFFIFPAGIRTRLTLDKLYPEICEDDHVLVSLGQDYRWFRVNQTGAEEVKVGEDTIININGSSTLKFTVNAPKLKVTQLQLDTYINTESRAMDYNSQWDLSSCPNLILHFNFSKAGTIVNDQKSTLPAGDALHLNGNVEKPGDSYDPKKFLLRDKNERGLLVGGIVDYESAILGLNPLDKWDSPFSLPVTSYGNLLYVSRGDQVRPEILGHGNASLANQTFKLRMKPLTYLFSAAAASDQAVASTLDIRVNGILWREVPSFFNTTPFDLVYIVRQDEECDSWITFGDGNNGQRLPSGRDNIVAHYRYGAGKATPPAGFITQIASPVRGLKSILNPVAAFGGADAETSAEMKNLVPKSAMILGRIVSIRDVEAVAASIPGVQTIQVEWRWNKGRQNALVHIYYIGNATVSSIRSRLNALSDPDVVYQVETAKAVKLDVVSVDINTDQRFDMNKIISDVRKCLIEEGTGILCPEKLGIGRPLFRSCVYEAVMAIEGVTAVSAILLGGEPFGEFGRCPGPGNYFTIDPLKLVINGITPAP